MAEKKKHNFVQSGTNNVTADKPQQTTHTLNQARPVGNATGYRLGAIGLWVAAFICEVLAVLILFGKINLKFMPTLGQLILFIILDLVFLIIGSQLWKKANHIKPMSEKNPTLFWMWNNMGVIVAVVCFCPLIILLLTNKNLDKRTKTIATVVAIIALLIGGVSGYDFNPVSQEQQQAAIQELEGTTVYWAPFGKVYHTHEDCGALNQTDTLTYGDVEQAIAEGRTRICSFCAKRDEITDLPTDE